MSSSDDVHSQQKRKYTKNKDHPRWRKRINKEDLGSKNIETNNEITSSHEEFVTLSEKSSEEVESNQMITTWRNKVSTVKDKIQNKCQVKRIKKNKKGRKGKQTEVEQMIEKPIEINPKKRGRPRKFNQKKHQVAMEQSSQSVEKKLQIQFKKKKKNQIKK